MKLLDANEQRGEFPPSYYAASAPNAPERPALAGDVRTDVCVIGGGFTGLSAALRLSELGYSVVLLEAHRVGWGASGRNGGQLGTGQRKEQPELEKSFGKDFARDLWDISEAAKALVKGLIEEHNIECGLKPGIIHANHRKRYDEETREYVDHMGAHYDYPLAYLPPEELRTYVKSPRYSAGVLDLDAAHLHPLKYARGLARATEATGVKIYEMSEVLSLDQTDPAIVRTKQGQVTADAVVLGCNGYLDGLMKPVARHVMPINNFIIATEPLDEVQVQSVLSHDYAVADSKFVVNYFRLSEDRRLLFGGRESYGYRFPRDIKSFVRKALVDIFPQTAGLKIDYGWGGTLAITTNRLPHLAQPASNIFNASGYSGHGVGMATMSGRMVADAIHGDRSRFDLMAKASGFPFPGGTSLRQPLLVAAMLWYSLLDRI